MPCDSRNSITNAIAGSYLAYFLSHRDKFSRSFQEADYLGTIKADTLTLTPSFSETPVYGDLRGPDNAMDGLLFPGDETIAFTLLEVNRPAVKRLAFPFSTTGSGLVRTDVPGVSGEGPLPGRLRSSYEGVLRLVPFTGNVSYWDNDLTFETGTNSPSGLSIRHFFHVMLETDGDFRENFKAGLLELPFTLRARSCRDLTTGQWRTHTYVTSLTAALP